MNMLSTESFVDSRHPIAAMLDARAEENPDHPMLIGGDGQTLSFSQVARLARNGADWLIREGVSLGDTVAWQLPTGLPAALLMLSLARLDVIQAPIIHICRTSEVRAATSAAGAAVLIVDGSTSGNVPEEFTGTTLLLPANFLDVISEHRPQDDHAAMPPSTSSVDDRWIHFTTGSTGAPKAVVHNDRSILSATDGFIRHTGLGSKADDVGSIVFPVAHIGGIIFLAGNVMAGYPSVIFQISTVSEFVETLRNNNVTAAGGSTAVYQMLIDAAPDGRRLDLPSLRILVGGGAACPPAVHHQAWERLGVPIAHAYGMTECPMICVERPSDTQEQRENSVGAPTSGAEVRIVRYSPEHPAGEEVGPGEQGEIEIRGASLTVGYLDKRAWRSALSPAGWFRTGDRGLMRPDGYVVVTGRTKDLIIRKGENIAPQEIEDVLTAHPLVEQVAVVGLPDADRGELVCAVIRRSTRHRQVSLTELCSHLAQQGLMKQKWPEKIVYVDDYPLTGLGKISRRELVEAITERVRTAVS
jgi:acyl-CoA synthetase (AMP-forming)/AMP-acid ligase II